MQDIKGYFHGPIRWSPSPLITDPDVLILGHGPAMLAAATHLAEAGVRVLLVATSPLADHESLGGLGIFTYPYPESPSLLVESLGAQDLIDLYGLGQGQIQKEMEAAKAVHATGIGHLAPRLPEAKSLAKSYPSLDAAGIKYRSCHEGVSAQSLGFAGQGVWPGGLIFEDAFLFDPRLYYQSILDRALNAGVHIYAANLLGPLCHENAAMEIDGHQVQGELALVGAGIKSRDLLPALGDQINGATITGLRIPQVKPASLLGATANGGYEAWRFTPAGDFLISGFRYMDVELAMGQGGPYWPKIEGRQRSYLKEFLGIERPPDARFHRRIAISCDGLPIVGPMAGTPRIHLLTGLAGVDFSLGIPLGLALAGQILGEGGSIPQCLMARRML